MKKWNELPTELQVEEIREYYDILQKKSFSLIIKRVFDILLSGIMIIILSPVMIVLALLIKLDSKGPVMFRQRRVTTYNRVFRIFKFRTMVVNAESKGTQVTTNNDPRVTKIGKLIRGCRLDELPQLFNVFLGDMTFVGPRPEMLENVSAYTKNLPEFKYRLRVKAGLTGYAQIFGKYNTSPKDKLLMDLMYIEQFSILKDLQLMFQTAIVLLKKDSTEAFSKKKDSKYKFVSVAEEEAACASTAGNKE